MRKFKIPKMYTTTNKTIRFPDNLIEQVEDAVRGTNCNFSQFVIEATRFALENMEEEEESSENANSRD